VTDRKRILFVDDEAAILASLSNLLRRDRHRWDLVFANGGPEGAHLIETSTFDVVVTDMRMPELDGAQLLELVRRTSPRTIRIMLSGHAESEAVIRALPLVHQFISKPCDIKTLRALLERCCQDSMLDPARSVSSAAGALAGLPSHPARYAELRAILDEPRCTVAQVTAIVERDPAMAAKLLRVANTSYFGTGHAITAIPAAVAAVGIEMIRQLARSHMFEPATALAEGFSLDELCNTSIRAAQLARQAADPVRAEEAYAIALLDKIGRLVLAAGMREKYGEVLATAARTRASIADVEREQLGVTSDAVRAQLFVLWALPPALIHTGAN
jgi:HD-like signal output (HDOD) protein